METENSKKVPDVHAIIAGRSILLKLPKNKSDIAFIRSLGFSRWDTAGFCWVIQNYPANHVKLSDYFAARIQWHDPPAEAADPQQDLQPAEERLLEVTRISHSHIRLAFRYDAAMVVRIKELPMHSWDPATKTWTLPHTEKILASLMDFCTAHEWKYTYSEKAGQGDSRKKPVPSAIKKTRQCPQEYVDKFKLVRYSPRTLQVYSDCFTEFLNYYPDKEPADITRDEIMAYLLYLVTERCISTSYQNQAINAIKFYYEKVLGKQKETYYIERPRRETVLPEVLSEEEMKALIGTIQNLKHKCMIMTAYSAGLRVGELLNLHIVDIDSKRMQIRVVQGKGKKDRVTLLSVKLLKMLRQYFLQYRPTDYLFTGASGGRYSERSVQNILKQACKNAKITKHVTMHTLRHSFATHLLEHNVDIRYIKELLGHTNLKTTQIYTHVTTKGFDQLVSPLDNLNL